METRAQIIVADAAAALPLLAMAAGDDRQGLGLDRIVEGCDFFMLEGVQGARLAYALKAQGSELWIQAAGGLAGFDLTVFGLAAIEAQAAGRFNSVGFQTRRKGLIKKAGRAGYAIDGVIMRKALNV